MTSQHPESPGDPARAHEPPDGDPDDPGGPSALVVTALRVLKLLLTVLVLAVTLWQAASGTPIT